MTDTYMRVAAVACDQFAVPAVDEDTTFTDLGADSLDAMQFQMALEDEFHITVPDDTMDRIKTIGEAVTAVEGLRRGQV